MSDRPNRYRALVRGWDWRTRPERLAKAEERRKQLGINRTQFIEYCIDKELGMNNPTFEIKDIDGCNVATVTYPDGATFTPSDWQGPQPTSAAEIDQYVWSHINSNEPADTAQWSPAVVLLGWPRVI